MSNPRETLPVTGCQNTDIVRVNSDGFFREAGRRDPLTDKLYKIFEQVVKTGEIGTPDFMWFHSPFCWKKEVGNRQGTSFLCVIDTGLERDGMRGLSKMGIYQTDEQYLKEVAAKKRDYAPYTPSPYCAHFVIIRCSDTDHFSCFVYFEREKIHEWLSLASLTELSPRISARVDCMLTQVLESMGIPSGNSLQPKSIKRIFHRFFRTSSVGFRDI